jgi:Holliday junction resolvase
MPINSRAKGARFEREIANILKNMGIKARRGQQFSGLEGEDVVTNLSWHVECKAVQNLNVQNAYEQSLRDSKEGTTPVVIHKKNRKPIMITMRLEDFPEAIKQWQEAINEKD